MGLELATLWSGLCMSDSSVLDCTSILSALEKYLYGRITLKRSPFYHGRCSNPALQGSFHPNSSILGTRLQHCATSTRLHIVTVLAGGFNQLIITKLRPFFFIFLSGMWSSRDMRVSEDNEIMVRTTIRELIVYGLFLTNLCICKILFKR